MYCSVSVECSNVQKPYLQAFCVTCVYYYIISVSIGIYLV